MGIDIYVSDTEIDQSFTGIGLPHVCLEDDMTDLIWKHRDIFKENIKIFLELEPYDDMALSNKQIKELKLFAKDLLKEEKISLIEKDFRKFNMNRDTYIEFATKLVELCQLVLDTNKILVSEGD